jgi:hypothetical protein
MPTKTTTNATVEEVARWRQELLTRSGFALSLATKIADDPHYDLHALIELVECGCRPDLAARILAPLEQGDAA